MNFLDRFRRKPRPEFGVLMVCMGNLCRSPMAEGVLRHKLAQAGLARRVQVDSAGTHADRGAAVDHRAVSVAAKRGYALDGLRSRRIVDADFAQFDWVIAMDQDNLANLRDLCPPEQHERLLLLLGVAARPNGLRDVPDPYYGAENSFELVLDLLEPACDALVLQISKTLAAEASDAPA